MPETKSDFDLRPARPSDLAAVGYISHQTGLLGEPITRYFPDQSLWTDAFVAPYFASGCCNLAAEKNGRVVAYIIGNCRHEQLESYVAGKLPKILLSRWLKGAYPAWRRELGYLWRAWRSQGHDAPWDEYPAHLHINALPQARGLGVGSALLERFLDCLRRQGVAGVQLGTTERNAAALRLYRKFGFEVYQRYRSSFWKPVLGEALWHLRLVKKLR